MGTLKGRLANTPPSGAGQIDVVIFGASTDEHCHVSVAGTLEVVQDPGTSSYIGTFTMGGAPGQDLHLLTHGVPCFLGSSTPNSAVEDYRWFGLTKVLTPSKLQMNLSDNCYRYQSSTSPTNWPATGPIQMGCHFLSSWCASSWYKELYRQFPGRAINLITTYALGGQTIATKLTYYKELTIFKETLPQLVVGSFGIGNSIFQKDDAQISINSLNEMLEYLTGKGIMCWVCMSPATANLDPDQCAIGQKILQALIKIRARNPLVMIANQFPHTIKPAYGYGDINLFYDKTIHANRAQATQIGKTMGPQLLPMVGPTIDERVNGRFDRFKGVSDTDPRGTGTYNVRSAESLQLIVGAWQRWANIGTPPWQSENYRVPTSPADVNATGTLDEGVLSARATGPAGAISTQVVCSLLPDPDPDYPSGEGYGLVQRFEFSGNAGARLDIVFRGGKSVAPNQQWEFWRFLQVGQTYEVACSLSIKPDRGAYPNVRVLYYEHYISLSIDGTGGQPPVVGRISENMREDHAAGSNAYDADPNERYKNRFTQDITEDNCYFPAFTPQNTVSGGSWNFSLVLDTAGKVTVEFKRMTMRQVVPAPAQEQSLKLTDPLGDAADDVLYT